MMASHRRGAGLSTWIELLHSSEETTSDRILNRSGLSQWRSYVKFKSLYYRFTHLYANGAMTKTGWGIRS